MMNLYAELSARGLVQDATPGLAERLDEGPVTAYVGFDPTAESLHVGNLIPMMAMAWVRRAGGTAIGVLGGGTGVVGDPSGKRTERPLLDLGTLDQHVARIHGQLETFLRAEGTSETWSVVNNADWLRPIPLLDFLRDTGKHFTLNYMLQKESVKSRMESGISFTEFAYMLVQAYDFWHLYRTSGCELQMGGSDQWGNITAGIELVSRREGAKVHGLVVPLFTTAKGTKFGKTEEGNVWLDPARTSPYRFYQFWLNADDRDVESLLKFFTFLPLETIRAIQREHDADPARRLAQRRLAEDVTTRIHGQQTTTAVIQASHILFGEANIRDATPDAFDILAGEIPTGRVGRAALEDGLGIIDALLVTELASSKADARRGIQGKGFAVNGVKIDDTNASLSAGDLLAGRYILLQKGKKNHALVVAEE